MKKLPKIFGHYLIVTVFLLTFCVSGINAATYTVNLTNDTGDGTCDATCTLRDAVLTANSNTGADTIEFDSGVFSTMQTITLSGQITISNSSNSDVTINGPGANLLTVSGGGTDYIFELQPIPVITISGMTLTGGNTTATGGALYVRTGTPNGAKTLSGLVVTGNTAVNGGGIWVGGGVSLTINNCTISNNNANLGGGIYATSDNTTSINNSIISGNTATTRGGGIHMDSSVTLNLNNSTINNNEAQSASATTSAGGGIYNNAGTANITDSTISGNRATAGVGGGIGTNSGNNATTVQRSTISGNRSNGNGAGMHIGNSRVDIINSTISGNTITGTGGGGGGIYKNGAANQATISYSTIANNTATGAGGGINSNVGGGGVTNVGNTIIADNTDNGTAPDYSGTLNSQDYNLIENTTGTTFTGTTTNNITGQDPMLVALANNGGPTFTHKLNTGSPAIDAANTGNFPATDQRGVMRPIDGNTSNLVAQPDIGSYEAAAPTAALVNVSGKVSDGYRGIEGAVVTLTDSSGNSHTTRTNSFGYFTFVEVEVGQTYIIKISARRYQFVPQAVFVTDELRNLNFYASSKKLF